ncbi:gamma-glutamylcyclotransferase [Nordella sp. HKS 07]|uniref:gamma-glutamylcyclotransferase n=1 Tax=Nordella sp. HKS 07 TaxID=2712222 RepID=UPI0013E1A399|nr:gamma-glutamylcyclotransferase [Nordella sp. HKS 07]QIG47238.1 gamma-glutamylcyclotransferase [Nordella sp. HKS 07]
MSYFTEEDYQAAAARLLDAAAGAPVWVFAYGSLLWRPAFEAAESRRAEAQGWRRDFCMEIRRWRGSPEQPGLMMALRKGGSCTGLALRLMSDHAHAQLVQLLKREVDGEEDLRALRWIEVDTAEGVVRALACWADPIESRMFVDKPLAEQAHMLARACGAIGSGAAYLHQTVESLARLGLADDYISGLEALVAREIMKLASQRAESAMILDTNTPSC